MIHLLPLLFLTRCAQPVALSGGPKDIAPPKLNVAESTANLQTNFQKQDIRLVFDEFLKLNNPFQEVMVSPPLEFTPKIEARNKTLLFKFDEKEILRGRATYTINFGKSVQDLTEGNAVKDLRFVFSTGQFIDSLEVGGVVTDALTGKGVEDAIVMLYDNLADSVVRKELPFYFGRTDKSGKFTIQNIRADTFKVVALKEDFTNYKFDNSAESIGFLDDPIVLTDSTRTSIAIDLFKEAVSPRIVKADSSHYGKLVLTFNDLPETATINHDIDSINIVRQNVEDSLIVWHNTPPNSSWDLVVKVDTLIDTFLIKGTLRDSFLKNQTITPTKPRDGNIKPINPFKPLQIAWTAPLANIDTSKIVLSLDSLQSVVLANYSIDTLDPVNLSLSMAWQSDSIYTLRMLPGAVTGIRGTTLQDTVVLQYQPSSTDNFGDITLKITDTLQQSAYILELLYKSENKVADFNVSGDTLVIQKFSGLPAGNYAVRVTEDRNGNGRRDTGNYDTRQQPERQQSQAIEAVRAGWEVEATIDLGTFFKN